MSRIIVVTCLVFGLSSAATLRVPQDHRTIQSALNAARTGDTVLVAAGTYTENLLWPFQDGITLRSSDGAEQTIVDGDAVGRVITIGAAAPTTAATVIEGFTIQNGRLTGTGDHGAGINVFNAATIRNNHIINNHTINPNNRRGGGLHIGGADAVVHDNLIADNTITTTGVNAGGAGLHSSGDNIRVYNNVFESNILTSDGANVQGGAMHLSGDSAIVFNNLILSNEARATTGTNTAMGGGIYRTGNGGYVANNTLAGNLAISTASGGGQGGGIAINMWNPSDIVVNNIVVNNTVAGPSSNQNIGTQGGGIWTAGGNPKPSYDHNNVWNNWNDRTNSEENYRNTTPGTDAISADPLYITGPFPGSAGTYYLSQVAAGQSVTSPCVDAGTTVPTTPLNCDAILSARTTRTDELPDTGIPDMGYHYPVPEQTGIEEDRADLFREPGLLVRPNPVRDGQVSLQFRLPRTGPARIQVYDACGRTVLSRSLTINDRFSDLTLDLRGLPAGIYVLRLETNGFGATGKLAVQ